ncbi:glycosyltransferase family 2 protein [Roseivirga sp.]|uniref:glycosyltransferase family 2 protein n=1 Tax=Roseivirga sp. TaxID=1964215 RepID=UPI002B272041|nr:glycosyltransferase family 2 protein [Roseivirga sp.]
MVESTPLISVISPVYNAEKILPELIKRVELSLSSITNNFELILVEDCGTDDSWAVIEQYSKEKKWIRGIKLSRNFGQHYAISAGLDLAIGEWVVVMDCDLQDQPEEISKLYHKALTGYDIVLAQRTVRKDSYFKRLSSKLFYRTLGYLTGSKQDETVGNFGIYNKKVVAAIRSLKESIRFFPSMVSWVGFSKTSIEVKHEGRHTGSSNYTFSKLLRLSLDIILAYSDKPIRLVMKVGAIIAFVSFFFAVFIFSQWFFGDIEVPGYTSLIISLWLIFGTLLLTLGVIGLYIGKSFEEGKRRPIYIVEKSTF